MLKYNKQNLFKVKEKEATVNYIGMLLNFQKAKRIQFTIPSL